MSDNEDSSQSRTRLRSVENYYYPTVPGVLQASGEEQNKFLSETKTEKCRVWFEN